MNGGQKGKLGYEAKDGIDFYEMELKDWEREKLDLLEKISAEEKAKNQKEETN